MDYATPKDYEIAHFKKGDFQDQNGNYWCDMAIIGIGEPVRIVVKDPTQYHDGMTLFGHISEETGKTSGKGYLRFRKDKKDEYQQTTTTSAQGQTSSSYVKDDHTQESIARSVALKAAVDAVGAGTQGRGREFEVDEYLKTADKFLAWLQGSSTTSSEPEKSNVAQLNVEGLCQDIMEIVEPKLANSSMQYGDIREKILNTVTSAARKSPGHHQTSTTQNTSGQHSQTSKSYAGNVTANQKTATSSKLATAEDFKDEAAVEQYRSNFADEPMPDFPEDFLN